MFDSSGEKVREMEGSGGKEQSGAWRRVQQCRPFDNVCGRSCCWPCGGVRAHQGRTTQGGGLEQGHAHQLPRTWGGGGGGGWKGEAGVSGEWQMASGCAWHVGNNTCAPCCAPSCMCVNAYCAVCVCVYVCAVVCGVCTCCVCMLCVCAVHAVRPCCTLFCTHVPCAMSHAPFTMCHSTQPSPVTPGSTHCCPPYSSWGWASTRPCTCGGGGGGGGGGETEQCREGGDQGSAGRR